MEQQISASSIETNAINLDAFMTQIITETGGKKQNCESGKITLCFSFFVV
jgi:hypothetical protein